MKVKAFGVIPLQNILGEWSALLIQHLEGHWSFPKGRPESGEEPLESAYRELQEETGLRVEHLLSSEPFMEFYNFEWQGNRVEKTVYYYLAIVEGVLLLQEEEVQAAKWVSLKEIQKHLTFSEIKKMVKKIDFSSLE